MMPYLCEALFPAVVVIKTSTTWKLTGAGNGGGGIEGLIPRLKKLFEKFKTGLGMLLGSSCAYLKIK